MHDIEKHLRLQLNNWRELSGCSVRQKHSELTPQQEEARSEGMQSQTGGSGGSAPPTAGSSGNSRALLYPPPTSRQTEKWQGFSDPQTSPFSGARASEVT